MTTLLRPLRRAAVTLLAALVAATASANTLPQEPGRPLVVVPGLLGSRLCRPDADGRLAVVWGTVASIGQFPSLAMGATPDTVEPCGLIREVNYLGVYTQEVYSPLIKRLEAAGYEEGKTLFLFDYDWRLSVVDNAQRLAYYVDDRVPDDKTIDIVAHSMGGLIALTYALDNGGAPRIARLITAGTPWRGSVQVFRMIESGWGATNLLMGGLDGFRRTILGFPSMFDLMSRYEGCCDAAGKTVTGFDPGNADAWADLNWPGVATQGLPDLAAAQARQRHLDRIVGQQMPDTIEVVQLIGVDQRTPDHYVLTPGEGEADLQLRTSWAGDGTVFVDSAQIQDRVTYPTSFATHEAILNDESVQDFLITTLTRGTGVAVATVPVRERTSIFTGLGELVTLVGVAIETDQPAYRPGQTATATVHLSVASKDAVDAGRMSITITRPDGQPVPVTLRSDPEASDPSSGLEQSFSAQFETGAEAGQLTVTVAINGGAAKPRTVTKSVPVL